MSLEQQILLELRKEYPKDGYRVFSDKTGIQLTRIFRLFNGAKMRVEEYEKLMHLLKNKEKASFTLHLLEEKKGGVGDSFSFERRILRRARLKQILVGAL